jgi:hypothetical protein
LVRAHQPYPGALVPIMPANAPFAELVRLSKTSVADEIREKRSRMSK